MALRSRSSSLLKSSVDHQIQGTKREERGERERGWKRREERERARGGGRGGRGLSRREREIGRRVLHKHVACQVVSKRMKEGEERGARGMISKRGRKEHMLNSYL